MLLLLLQLEIFPTEGPVIFPRVDAAETFFRFPGTKLPQPTRPEWFAKDAVPLDRMWLDDRYWLPRLLAGRRFKARFLFRGQAEMLALRIDEAEEGDFSGADTAVPVAAGAKQQTSIPTDWG